MWYIVGGIMLLMRSLFFIRINIKEITFYKEE